MTAPQVQVTLSDGKSVSLAELYAEKPLVLVFLRHFGCTFCREQVARLRLHKDLNVAFVTMGTVPQSEDFKQKMHSEHTFIADPDRALYQAFGLGRGEGKQMFNRKTWARGFGAVLRGHWVGLPVGDPWQMPGVFLIETDGEVSWQYRSVDAQDNVTDEMVRNQLRQVQIEA